MITDSISKEEDIDICFICLENTALRVRSGCACRGTAGVVHVECMVTAAQHLFTNQKHSAWYKCQICCENFTGDLRFRLAEAWVSKTQNKMEHDEERMCAQLNMANSLCEKGMFQNAACINNRMLTTVQRNFGDEHMNTFITKSNIAQMLFDENKYEQGEKLLREVFEMQKKTLGSSDRHTLMTEEKLNCIMCVFLFNTGEYKKTEKLQKRTIEIRKLISGCDDRQIHRYDMMRAICFFRMGKYEIAEEIQRNVVVTEKRILGHKHPETIESERILQMYIKRDVALNNYRVSQLFV